ncbi:MAG: thioredoxin domain-containing protein [Candidatus Omnitrophota bacterium]|nr:thioredoxin domain-containing protein [Candidatus Omnitrophota bacterium]
MTRLFRGSASALVFSLAGIFLSSYLAFLHILLYRGELLGGLGCGDAVLGSFLDCHAVAASRFSAFLGLPVALWGLVGYLATAVLSLIAWVFPRDSGRALRCLLIFSLSFLAVDAVLLSLMIFHIRHLCLLCLLTYGVNGGLLVSALVGLRGEPEASNTRGLGCLRLLIPTRALPAAFLFWGVVGTGAAGVVAVHALAQHLTAASPGELRRDLSEYLQRERPVQVETAGAPRLGPADAPIQVVEFSDLLCPICRKSAQYNEIFLANHRNEIVIYFKHFPIEQVCNPGLKKTLHPGACQMAAAAACAQEQGKFWEFYGRVARSGSGYDPSGLEREAAEIGMDMERFRSCMENGRGAEAVRRDVEEGQRLGISGTPTYLINGFRFVGTLTPAGFDQLVRLLRERLAEEKLTSSGR